MRLGRLGRWQRGQGGGEGKRAATKGRGKRGNGRKGREGGGWFRGLPMTAMLCTHTCSAHAHISAGTLRTRTGLGKGK